MRVGQNKIPDVAMSLARRDHRKSKVGLLLGELHFISRSFYKVEVRIYGGDSFYLFSKFTRAHSASATGHRPEYSLLNLSNIWPRFHWRYFSRLLRIYIDTPQIEVEFYGGKAQLVTIVCASH
jgi:hypothetical protein